MKYLIRRTLLLFTFVCYMALAYAQESPPVADYNPKAWQEFSSSEGRFSVLLPGVPKMKVEQTDSPVGKIYTHNFSLRLSNQSPQYDVTYVDFPESLDMSDVKAIFDNVRDDGVKAVKGKLLAEKDVNLGEHPGRFYKVHTSDGNVMRIKAFLVKSRFYNLIFTTVGKNEPEAVARLLDETAGRFFDSFRLLSEPELAKFEGEVDRLLKELRAKNEIVIGACGEGAKCPPLPGIESVNKRDEERLRGGGIVSQPQPAYPPIAKAARAQGTVTVQVVVNEEGKVMAAQAAGGHPLLQGAAVAAARQALFTPTLLDGKPVKVSGVITYNFVLQ